MGQYKIEQLKIDGQPLILAYLIKILHEGEPFITYGKLSEYLSDEFGVRIFPKHVGDVLGAMMDAIWQIDPGAPPINILVSRPDGMPGDGISKYIEKFSNEHVCLSWSGLEDSQKYDILESIRKKIKSYGRENWEAIYRKLYGEGVNNNVLHMGLGEKSLKEYYSTQRIGSESQNHKALKKFVANNPGLLKIPSIFSDVSIEYPLLSGDVVDVVFSNGRDYYVVEVKSNLSNHDDLRRGVYQCVKYREVLRAQELPLEANVESILVTEVDLPNNLKYRSKLLGITHCILPVNK